MMELNAFQTTLKNFLQNCQAPADWGGDSKPLAAWLALGNADLLLQSVNSPTFSGSLNLLVGDPAVNMDSVCKRLAAASDYRLFSADLIIRLSLPLRGETFDFTDEALVGSVEAILEAGPHQADGEALAVFKGMKLRAATIAQHVAQIAGLESPASVSASKIDIELIVAASA